MIRPATWKTVIAVVIALAVLAIFVSPVVDSPATALRAKQLAQLIFLALIGVAMTHIGLICFDASYVLLLAADSAPPPPSWHAIADLALLC
jgi:hypothetical protein